MVDGSDDKDEPAQGNSEPQNHSVPLASNTGSATSDAEAHVRSVVPWARVARHWKLVIAVLVLALAGAGIVVVSTAKYGAGLSSDSVFYLDAARNLVSGRGFVLHDGSPLVVWPPLYSMLLALIGLVTGLGPAVFAHLVNAALFAVVICLSAPLFLVERGRPAIYGLLGLCAVPLSLAMPPIYVMALSDCLFTTFVLLYLVSAQRYWDSGGVLSLAVMTVSMALACLTRYLGLALVPAGVLSIVLASRVSFRTRIMRAVSFAALSLAPLGLWLLHVHRQGGVLLTPPGNRSESSFAANVAHCVTSSLRTICSWYLPGRPEFIFGVGLVVAVAAIIFSHSATARSRIANSVRAILSDFLPSVLLSVTYVFLLVPVVASAQISFIEERYLSPVYIPVTLILFELFVRLFSPTSPIPNARARRGLVVVMVLWLCFPLAKVTRSTLDCFRNGAGGYSHKEWRESGTVAYAKQMLSTNDDALVYSNGPDALWALAGVSATFTPTRTRVNLSLWGLQNFTPTGTAVNLSDLRGCWPAANRAILVWLRNITWRKWLFSIEELGEIADTVVVARFSDGAIYRVSAREAAAHEPSHQVGESLEAAPRQESLSDEHR
jgi:hypothetical protein